MTVKQVVISSDLKIGAYMFYDDHNYYVTSIANTLRVSRQAIYNYVKRGELIPLKDVKPIRIPGKEINKFIGGNSV